MALPLVTQTGRCLCSHGGGPAASGSGCQSGAQAALPRVFRSQSGVAGQGGATALSDPLCHGGALTLLPANPVMAIP